jgi:D-tyrosyl-tRNA(Tyr) deacylase
MKGLLQRVRGARVEVAGEIVGAVDQGLLVLVAVEPDDTRASADKLLHKLLNYRVFSDAEGKMNLSLADVGGGLLLVSQFTLAADTKSGLRPSFSTAAPPAWARNCSTIYSAKRNRCMALWHQVDSARICRCTWSMMAR